MKYTRQFSSCEKSYPKYFWGRLEWMAVTIAEDRQTDGHTDHTHRIYVKLPQHGATQGWANPTDGQTEGRRHGEMERRRSGEKGRRTGGRADMRTARQTHGRTDKAARVFFPDYAASAGAILPSRTVSRRKRLSLPG